MRPQTLVYAGLTMVGVAIVGYSFNDTPATLSERQKQAITQKVSTEVLHGELLYNMTEMRRPSVSFVRRPSSDAAEAMCVYELVSEGTAAWSVWVNEKLAAQHYHRFMTETIPHEVAHLLSCQMRNPMWWDHADMWSTIVRDMGATPVIRHDYAAEEN